MGIPGSGNFDRGKKETVEESLCIDANYWGREGIIRAGSRLSGSQRWTYHSGDSFHVDFVMDTLDADHSSVWLWYSWVWKVSRKQDAAVYQVALTTTRPHYGGLRWWFVCPLVLNGRACGRRVAKLYLPPSGRYFGCRHCHDLTYTSCQQSRKLDGLYRRLARVLSRDFDTAEPAL
jgi:hypothetical protein